MAKRADKTYRRRTAELLTHWLHERPFAETLLSDVKEHRAAVTELLYGALRRLRSLDWLIAEMAPRAPRPGVRAILCLGLYELFWMDDSPTYAVVHEAVETARLLEGPGAAKFINALLRRADRERQTLLEHLAAQPPGIALSHPDVVVDRWAGRLRECRLRSMLEWNNTSPGLIVRRLTSNINAEAFDTALRSIGAEPHPFHPERYYSVPSGLRMEDVPGYTEGWLIAQDPAAGVAVDLLAPQPGESLWDVCAAPGGKAAGLADALNGNGTVLATDINAERLKAVRDTGSRVGMKKVKTYAMDALKQSPVEGPFDAVLLDVPCTNTGVFRRRPDARWRFDADRLKWAVKRQRALLDQASKRVKPGGRLVYSTCSMEPEENGEQVRHWLETHSAWKLMEEREILPGEHGADGAYVARVEHSV